MKGYRDKLIRSSSICYLCIVVLFVTIRLLAQFGLLAFLGNTGSKILSAGIQIILLFSTSIFLFSVFAKEKPKQVFKFYGYKKTSWKVVVISILIGIIVYILNVYFSSIMAFILELFGYKYTPGTTPESYSVWRLLLTILLTAILPAICEETAHRGMLYKSFSSKGRAKAIIISSILFGLLHCNIEQFFYATAIGLFLGYLVSMTENILPAIIIHFVNNLISVLMGYSQFHNLGWDYLFTYTSDYLTTSPVLGILFFWVLVALLVIAMKYLVNKLFKHTVTKDSNELQRRIFNEVAKNDYLKELQDIQANNSTNNSNQKMIPFEEFDILYKKNAKELGLLSEIDIKIMQSQGERKIDKISKALIITSFVILSAMTIFSFVWGIIA